MRYGVKHFNGGIMMARTDEEVARILTEIYSTKFAGKQNQRFLISWSDIRSIYGFERLFPSRFDLLKEAAVRRRLYLWDLGESDKKNHRGLSARAR